MKTKTKSLWRHCTRFELRVVYLMRSYCGGGTRKKAARSDSTMLKHSAQFIRVHDAIDFRLIVKGAVRALRPVVRDQVCLVVREGLVNVLRHASATEVEVELIYAADHFRLFIRDNGCGFDARTLTAGHVLSGMRQLAERVGAQLKVMSRVGIGTEIRLLVPALIAFTNQIPQRR